MLDRTTYTLAHPEVQAAKKLFKDRRKRKSAKRGVSFDWLFERFQSDDVRFNSMAKKVGLSSERLRTIYDTYFAQFFGLKSGRDRRHGSTIGRHLAQIQQSERMLLQNNPLVKAVRESAQAAGCTVRTIWRAQEGAPASARVHTRLLRINGHPCSLHHLQSSWRPSPNHAWYTQGGVRPSKLQQVAACIILVDVKGFPKQLFVVPSSVFSQVNAGSFYIPLKKGPRMAGPNPLIEWPAYKNAWHLLPKKCKTPAPS